MREFLDQAGGQNNTQPSLFVEVQGELQKNGIFCGRIQKALRALLRCAMRFESHTPKMASDAKKANG